MATTTFRRALASSLSLGMLVAVGGPAGPGWGQTGREVTPGRVSENTRFQRENNDPIRGRDMPGLAVNPSDPRHIVMIDEDFLAGQCDYHVSFDGGRTWDSGHLTVPSDFADPPCRTFDSGGYAHFNKSVVFGSGQNVYTTFASHRGEQQRPESRVVAGEGDSVIVNRSTDGGRTFERGVVAIQGGTNSWPFIIRPGVAVQPRPQGDKLYVVGWHVVNPPGMGASGGERERKAIVATSEDGGRTWSQPVEAQGPEEKVREIAPPVRAPTAPSTSPGATATTRPTPLIRLTGNTPADIGRAVAGALDVRSAEEKGRSVPAFGGAVVVNPASDESAAALAFAASQRYPVLFADRDGVPPATAEAFNSLAIQNTWVVGSADAVTDSAMARLPGAKRLGGTDAAATSAAVLAELRSRGLPVNVVYVADESRPVDAAVGAAAVARLGGFLLLTPGGDAGAAEQRINELGLSTEVDQIVVGESVTDSNIPWALIVLSGLFAVAGIVLLDRAARKNRQRRGETTDSPVPSPTTAPHP